MVTPELKTYVSDELKNGTPANIIKQNLQTSGGWLPQDIEEAIGTNSPTKAQPLKKEMSAGATTFAVILIIINLVMLFAVPLLMSSGQHLFNSEASFTSGISGILLFFLSFPFSVLSIIFGFIYTFRRKTTGLAVFLLLLSIFCSPLIGPPLVARLFS